MSAAIEQVAASEAAAVDAAAASVVAGAAAETAVIAADILVAQVTQNAAEKISEAEQAIEQHESETQWLKTQMTEMQARQMAMGDQISGLVQTVETLTLSLKPAQSEASQSLTQQPEQVSHQSADAVDPLAAEKTETPNPAAQQSPLKRRKFL